MKKGQKCVIPRMRFRQYIKFDPFGLIIMHLSSPFLSFFKYNMDFTYPQLFDIVDETTFDTDLFHGLNLQDVENNKKQHNSSSPSYLHYLQSTNTNNNTSNIAATNIPNIPNNNNNASNFFYDSMHPLNLDLIDYDYNFQQTPSTLDQKQQCNWLYDPIDTYLPQQNNLFCDDTMMSNIMSNNQQQSQFDSIMSDNDMEDSITTVDGGMSRGYVSLSVSF